MATAAHAKLALLAVGALALCTQPRPGRVGPSCRDCGDEAASSTLVTSPLVPSPDAIVRRKGDLTLWMEPQEHPPHVVAPSSGTLLQSSSPIEIAPAGPPPDPAMFGDFLLFVGGDSPRAAASAVGQGEVCVTVDSTPDLALFRVIATPDGETVSGGGTSLTVCTEGTTGLVFFARGVAPSSALRAAVVTASSPDILTTENPVLDGTVAAVTDVSAAPGTVRVREPVVFTSSTAPSDLGSLVSWTVDRQDGASFNVVLVENGNGTGARPVSARMKEW